jgi:hypothetical protein
VLLLTPCIWPSLLNHWLSNTAVGDMWGLLHTCGTRGVALATATAPWSL